MDVISLAVAKKFGMKANVFKYQGSCAFEDLPTQDNEVGDVWNITDEFDLDGQHYEAGTNVAWDGEAWDALSASIDTSIFELNANKVTSISDQSTDIQYPSAKAVFDSITDSMYVAKIEEVATSAQNPFVFEGKKKGLYFLYSIGTFYYKILETSDKKSLATTYNAIALYLSSDFDPNAQIEGRLLYYNNDTGALQVCKISVYNGSINVGEYNPSKWNASFLINRISTPQTIRGFKIFEEIPELDAYEAPEKDVDFAPKKYVDDSVLKYTVMPTAGRETVGQIVQYIGTTDQNYTAGYFYAGASQTETVDNEEVTTYFWEQIDVQPNINVKILDAPINPSGQSGNCPLTLSTLGKGIYQFPTTASDYPFYVRMNETDTATNLGTLRPMYLIVMRDFNDMETPTSNDTKYSILVYVTSDGKSELRRAYINVDNQGVPSLGNSTSWGSLLTSGAQTFYGEKTFIYCPKTSSAPTTNNHLTNKKYVDDQVAKTASMNTSSAWLGKIVQYIGETNADFTKGYFYIEVQTSVTPERYAWQQIDVQPTPTITTATSEQIQALFGTEGGE